MGRGGRGPDGRRRGGDDDNGDGRRRGGRHGGRAGRPGRGGRPAERVSRDDVRLSVLALLTERPMHGYELMSELEARTAGAWRPAPGSIYPVLAQMQDEGLLDAEPDGSRRVMSLTAAGARAAQAAGEAPWTLTAKGLDPARGEVRSALESLRVAADQVLEVGTDADRLRLLAVLSDARRALYLLLAGEG